MTKDFEAMLRLFGKNANGAECSLNEEVNIEEIRRYSLEQGVWTMVFPELIKISPASQYKTEFLALMTKAITRKSFALEMIRRIEKMGIPCCMLKGATVSALYQNPEYRISSDTDILIHPKYEKRLKKILLQNGYEVEQRAKNEHHLVARHPIGGILEVHVMLYSNRTSEILFDGLNMYNEPWRTIEIEGNNYHTLGVNDGLMYLTAHYIKHLILSGGGVRQMMDLLLYIEANKEKIDFDRYNRMLEKLRYKKLVDVIKIIGAMYFGFDYKIEDEALATKILEDTEAGGIFGAATDKRKRFYNAYCDRRTSMSGYKYKLFVSLKSEYSLFDKFFPKQSLLVDRFGYRYAKHKFFIPLAWVHRYFDLLFKKRSKKTETPIHPEFVERMQLMKDLEMIK